MPAAPPGSGFAPTRWSVVAHAGVDSPDGRAALSWLCEAYWEPLRRHLRRRGMDDADAQDAVQALFARLIERRDLAAVDPARGRFRSWLLTALRHDLADRWDHQRALKRGGGARHVPVDVLGAAEPSMVDVDADGEFDRDWARALLARALERLRAEQADGGRKERAFAHLRTFLSANGDAVAYAAVGEALGLGEGAVKVAVHRLRQRFREALRAEVADTIADPGRPGAIDDEVADLLAALGADDGRER